MTIAYLESGARKEHCLILLHAFPLNKNMWSRQLEVLSDYVHVISPDLPGFGHTPLGRGKASLERFADEIFKLMLKKNVNKAFFGGCSMGGYLVFELWRMVKDHFLGAFLFDTRADADTDEIREKREATIKQLEENGIDSLVESMLPLLTSPATRENNPALIEQIEKDIRKNSIEGLISCLRLLAARPDSWSTVKKIDVPTLLIYGEDDVITPPEVGKEISSKIKKSKFVTIPEAGHLSPYEQPEAVNKAILDFLFKQKFITNKYI